MENVEKKWESCKFHTEKREKCIFHSESVKILIKIKIAPTKYNRTN